MAVKERKESIRTAIRADGGYSVGFGHLSRCSSLAKAISRRISRADISFWCRQSDPVNDFLTREGFKANFFNIPESIEFTRELMRNFAPHVLVMDMAEHIPEAAHQHWTAIDREYSKLLAESAVISIQLDDFALGNFNTSIVVNGGIVEEYTTYKGTVSGELLCGPQYVLLRPEFTLAGRNLRNFSPKITSALIVDCGNSFTSNIPHFLSALEKQCPDVKVRIISKTLFEAQSKPQTPLKVEYQSSIQDMAEAMTESDIAFTGGGTILYELAASGTPAIVFPAVEHQIPISRKFATEGTVVDLGPSTNSAAILDAVKSISGLETRKSMSDSGRAIVDGMGSDRVAAKILELLSSKSLI